MPKDYYKILGVTEFDTAENIKSAYRKLARKWHPDVAGNSSECLTKFKEISEAYQILSNKVKKEEYDRARRFYNYAHDNKKEKEVSSSNKDKDKDKDRAKENKNEKIKKSFESYWDEFISNSKKKFSESQNNKNMQKKGDDIHADVDISILEALSGCSKTINLLQNSTCPKCNGKRFINGTICPECNGKGDKNTYKKFTVKIPAEIKDGAKIRLAGEGGIGINGGKNGDLYITIHVLEAKNYKTDGLNIHKTIPITPFEAVLGAKLSVNTLNGNVFFNIQPNTQNGQKIRLCNCGLVQNEKIGDMIVTVEIKIPKNLTVEEIELYKKLEKISSSNIREQFYDR